jgi:hypothetical protein
MKFKVGDKVKVISCYDNYYDDLVGKEFIIKRTIRERWYELNNDGEINQDDWSFREDDLQLINPITMKELLE